MKFDVTKPYKVVLDCFDGHTDPQESSSLQPLSSNTFEKGYMADGVKRIPVREGRIRGTIFLPLGDGPFSGEQRKIDVYLKITASREQNSVFTDQNLKESESAIELSRCVLIS